MDRGQVARCPRCGCRADATETVTLHLTPEAKRTLGRFADTVRRERRLATDDEAIVAAVSADAAALLRLGGTLVSTSDP